VRKTVRLTQLLQWQAALLLTFALVISGCNGSQNPQPPPAGGSAGKFFTLTLDPAELTITQGQSAQTTLTITPQNGFVGNIHLILTLQDGSPAPSGITLSPNSIAVSSSNPVTKILTISISNNIEPGVYNLRLVGKAGEFSASTDFKLLVQETSTSPTFALSLNPSELTVIQGESAQTTLTITPRNGFAGNIKLDLLQQDGRPAPNGLSLSPTYVTVRGEEVNQTLTINVARSVSAGTYHLRLIGSANDKTAYTDFVLIVNEASGSGEDEGSRIFPGVLLADVIYEKGTYIAVGFDQANETATILTSHDGKNWIKQNVDVPSVLTDVAHGSGIYVAVGYTARTKAATILTSPDAKRWTKQNIPTAGSLIGVAYGNGIFVAVGYNEQTQTTVVFTSSDGKNWTKQDPNMSLAVTDVIYANRTFIAIGNSSNGAVVLASSDGQNWTRYSLIKIQGALGSIIYGNGIYVTVGFDFDSPLIFTSSDGRNWNRQNVSVPALLIDVTYGNGLYVTVGFDRNTRAAVILTSKDGRRWTKQNTGGAGATFGITYGNGLYVAVGYDENTDTAVILTSPDGKNWHMQ